MARNWFWRDGRGGEACSILRGGLNVPYYYVLQSTSSRVAGSGLAACEDGCCLITNIIQHHWDDPRVSAVPGTLRRIVSALSHLRYASDASTLSTICKHITLRTYAQLLDIELYSFVNNLQVNIELYSFMNNLQVLSGESVLSTHTNARS